MFEFFAVCYLKTSPFHSLSGMGWSPLEKSYNKRLAILVHASS